MVRPAPGYLPRNPLCIFRFLRSTTIRSAVRLDTSVSLWALYAPPALAGTSWDEAREGIGEALIDYVSALVPDFRADMREWLLLTPQDLEARVGLTAGNIRHLDMIPSQLLARRPLSPGGYDTPIRGLLPLRVPGLIRVARSPGRPGHNAAQSILRARDATARRSTA